MKQALISEERAQYMPLGLKQYCFGNRSECSHFEEDGAVILPWGQVPEVLDFANIESLRLLPTLTQIKKAEFPDYIRLLPNLIFLEIPLPMALKLKKEHLPEQLKTLMVSSRAGQIEMLVARKQPIVWPDIVLPKLKGLWFFNGFGSSELNSLLNISQEKFPSLEYLECRIGKDDSVMDSLKYFKSLRFLHVENIGVSQTFRFLADSLKYLTIVGTKKDFKLIAVTESKSLVSLWLNTIKTEFDCNIFTFLPDLLEINILNSKKVFNTEALLECVRLKSIYFLDCGKPFRLTKDRFLASSYDRLDIKYS